MSKRELGHVLEESEIEKVEVAVTERTPEVFEFREGWLIRNSSWMLFVFAFCSLLSVVCVVFWHFQLGGDIWALSVKNHETAAYWGQIGDFAGGILNPILSFVALLAVLSNLVMQRKELSLARNDAKAAHDVQMEQRDIFERQNFESVFFQLLESHSRIVSNLKVKLDRSDEPVVVFRGREVFEALIEIYVPLEDVNSGDYYDGDIPSIIVGSARSMMFEQGNPVGHYFRNIYQLLKYIDGFGLEASDGFHSVDLYAKVVKSLKNYNRQRTYANMLRAQLSSPEVSCIFLSGLTSEGVELKYYLEKYSILKNLDDDQLGTDAVKLLYAKCAFQESEDIDMREIIRMTAKKYAGKA
jgi:hypothetical protein